MNMIKVLSFTFAIVSFVSTSTNAVKVVLPESWEGFSSDTTSAAIVIPQYDCCYEIEGNSGIPFKHWKALIVSHPIEDSAGKQSNLYASLVDVKLQATRFIDFQSMNYTSFSHEGAQQTNNLSDRQDASVLLYIANYNINKPIVSLYDGRFRNDKNLSLILSAITYNIEFQSTNTGTERLVINSSAFNQTIYESRPEQNKIGKVLWAGDINEDNILDIVVYRFGKEGLYQRIDLWVSNKAKCNGLHLYSSFYYGGCS